MSFNAVILVTFASGVLALLFAAYKAAWIYRQEVYGETLKRISGYVADGAMAFIKREYKVLACFVLGVAVLLGITQSGALKWEAAAFMLGAGCSALAGFFGMKVATAANSRTTSAARIGITEALLVAFSGGTVMGMCVVGLALLGISIVLGLCSAAWAGTPELLNSTWFPILSGFSLGASSIALFARLGGGIYTKAADVGADLVGKVEASIPEDDPRNPATIADNVGDNVGDVAGMGADLFESYVGSIVGALILAVGTNATLDVQLRLAGLPLLLAALGVVASIIGALMVRAKPGESPQKALNTGTLSAALLATVFTYPLCSWVMGDLTFVTETGRTVGAFGIFLATVFGLAAGVAIGFLTEYYTGSDRKPVLSIVKSCETGSATTIITGLGVGMLSTVLPIIVLSGAILGTYRIAGLYGVAMAALGMLITLGVQLAVDAYGPIADNAGGLAQMSEFPPSVRKITDSLDAVGNTTAAIGKGFAIGSAALTAIILLTAFRQAAGVGDVLLTDPTVLAGLFVGGMIPFLFSAMAMSAIGRSAFAMIEEVRRQFREIPGLLAGTGTADYARCVDISTAAALKEMVLPGVIAIAAPVVVGYVGGAHMLTGMLTGTTVTGVLLAIFMANSGGAWDNAKKMIEDGHAGGKGSDAHKAAVVGDTVGDPFKDTAGPALNILMKLMAVVSLIIAPLIKATG
jgi:K(+)-stimulated pyrophosphate-energized sodium pump